MITIEQPAMVLNCISDWYISDYEMEISKKIKEDEDPADIIQGDVYTYYKGAVIEVNGKPK